MSKLHRRGYLAISTLAAASALLVSAPAGASAAEESGSGSTPGATAVEPSGGSTQPAAPGETEWTPQDAGNGTSSGGSAPLEHGSSVGSGVVNGKAGSTAGSDSEPPPPSPDSSGSYEPESVAPATVEAPAGAPQVEGGVHPVQPTAAETEVATAIRAGDTLNEAAVGGAVPLAHSASPQGGEVGSASPAAVASFTNPGDRVPTSSYALLLLFIVALGLVFTFAGARIKRRRLRRQLEAFWHEQDVAWEAALRQVEQREAPEVSESSAQPLERVNAA